MNLKQQRAAALKAAQDIVAQAKADGRDLTDAEQVEVEAKSAEVADLDKKIEAAAKSADLVARIGSIDPEAKATDDADQPSAKSLGDHFVKHAGDQLARAKGPDGQSRFSVSAPEFKANTDFQALGTVLAPAVTQVDTNIVQGFRRRLTIADLL